MINRIEQRVLKRQPVGEDRIGWADIFDLTFLAGDFQPGRLYLLGSRPGEGKTAFVSMLARAASISKKQVGFIALRDSEESVSLRLMGGEAQCDPTDFHKGKLGKEGIMRLCDSASKMTGTFPSIASLPDPSTISLCEFAKELKASKKLQFLVIDDVGFAFGPCRFPDLHVRKPCGHIARQGAGVCSRTKWPGRTIVCCPWRTSVVGSPINQRSCRSRATQQDRRISCRGQWARSHQH